MDERVIGEYADDDISYKLPDDYETVIKEVERADNKKMLKKFREGEPNRRRKTTFNKKGNKKKWIVPIKH